MKQSPNAHRTSQAGSSSRVSEDEIRAIVAASGVYDVGAERRNVVFVEGLLLLEEEATTEATLAPGVGFLEAPPRAPPSMIQVTAALSPETRRRIEKEASRLREVGWDGARVSANRLPNVPTTISDDVYGMYTTGRGWPERMMWAIGGDLVATWSILNDGRADDQPSSSDDERGESLIGS